MNADPHTLGEVFIWFTTQGYVVKDEELFKTPIQSSDENHEKQVTFIGNLIINGDFLDI